MSSGGCSFEPWWKRTLYAPGRLVNSGYNYWSGWSQPKGTRYNYHNTNFGRDGRKPLFADEDELWWKKDKYLIPDNDTNTPVLPIIKGTAAVTRNANLHKEENRSAHHGTARYEVPELVLRRGQPFKLTITLDRDYEPSNDKIALQLTIGSRPMLSKHTLLRFCLGGSLKSDEWSATEDSYSGRDVTLNVMIPPDAIVATYKLFVITSYEDENGKKTEKKYKHLDEIYILFNAWCKDDSVYLDKEDEREEYVMSDHGRIWQMRRPRGKPWYFGQFESVCLRAAMKLLDTSYLSKQAHGNPIQVIRALSAMANSNDNDGGVLTGNWSGDYRDGTSPTKWNGSYRILQEFMIHNKEVKYGQCWVFSGLLTTLCRTLGIPARSVTNFSSAHDKDYSMTIDRHIDFEGRPLRHMDDSVWNFHVWNEAWMKRPDLPTGTDINSNDGWQAFDSTPQEASEGIMRCGPASVNAIKRGDVYLGYDSKFIFAEVNGDKVTWQIGEDFEMNAIDHEPKSVGTFIYTKQIGKPDPDNVTENYKYKEGSEKEREAVKKASRHSSRKDPLASLYDVKDSDVEIGFDSRMASTGDIEFVATAKNKSKDDRTLKVRMYTVAKYYTGVCGEELDSYKADVTVKPNDSEEQRWMVGASEWMNKLAEDATIGVYVTVKVKETGQTFSKHRTMELDKPDLEMTASSKSVRKGKELEVTVRFNNPLSIPLSDTVITLEGAGIETERTINIRRSVKPGNLIKEKVKLFPKMKGKREVIANLHCRQLTNIVGSVEVNVTD